MALAAQAGNDNTVVQDSTAHSKEQGHDPSAASLLETAAAINVQYCHSFSQKFSEYLGHSIPESL
jgi:hypothetical protein